MHVVPPGNNKYPFESDSIKDKLYNTFNNSHEKGNCLVSSPSHFWWVFMKMMRLKETEMVIYGGFRKPALAVMMQEGWRSSGNRSRCFQGLLPALICLS